MLLCLRKKSTRAKLLETGEAGEAFNITENKKNSIIEIFFIRYYLDLELLRMPWE